MGCTVAVVKDKTKPKIACPSLRTSIRRTSKDAPNFGDAVTILDVTDRQIFQLQQSWKGISRKMEYTGINMFIRMFETNSELKKFFFVLEKCHTIAEMRESKALAKHVVGVMNALDETIYNLNDMNYVTEFLLDIGKQHRKLPDYKREFFLSTILSTNEKWQKAMTEPFLLAVKETLGDRYTKNMATIYRRLIQYVISTIFQGFGSTTEEIKIVTP